MSEKVTMDELLPCPFCGGSAELHDLDAPLAGNGTWELFCGDCLATITTSYILEGYEGADKPEMRARAVELWNARASLPVGVPDGEWILHMLEDRWPDSGELVEVEAFADWLREVLAAPTVKESLSVAPTVKAEQVKTGADWVMRLLDTGEWRLTRFRNDPSMTEDYCRRNSWQVERQCAPYCGDNEVTFWRAETAEQAFTAAINDLFPGRAAELGRPAPSLPAAGSADLTAVRCQCCATEYPHDSYDAGFIAGSGMCQVCDAAIPAVDLPSAAPAEQPYPHGIAEDLERSDWAPLEALQWYAAGKHFDVADGRTRIIDTGAVASNALKHASLAYLELKGDAELSELRAALSAQQSDPWAPSDADYDHAIHRNPDARAWADFFVATFPGQADKHDLMIGWFANAMMAMHDHLKAQQPEFCCEHSYKVAKQAAWGKRDLTQCKCDHNEYCEHCWPDDFREGGKWHGGFADQQSAPERVSVPRELLERLETWVTDDCSALEELRALLASHGRGEV